MELKRSETNRGFAIVDFIDRYDKSCSIQKSSLATEDAIWFGIDDPEPEKLVKGRGWVPVELDPEIILSTRMHLTRKQVLRLLPILIKFVLRGEI